MTPATPIYFEMPGAPGKYFHCEAYKSRMSVGSCAGMYAAEKGRQNGRHPHCNGCAVGAVHAGEKPVEASAMFGAKICPRCTHPAMRIVKGVCVSCINRQYEIERNCNAKGSAPSRLPTLHAMTVTFAAGGEVQARNYSRVKGRVEAMLRVLRTQQGDVEFAWAPAGLPVMPQASLFNAPPRAQSDGPARV